MQLPSTRLCQREGEEEEEEEEEDEEALWVFQALDVDASAHR